MKKIQFLNEQDFEGAIASCNIRVCVLYFYVKTFLRQRNKNALVHASVRTQYLSDS